MLRQNCEQMSEHPIDNLRTGQFAIRRLFFLVTFCALSISAFLWLPFVWASNAIVFGMLAISFVVGESSPLLRSLLLTLTVSFSVATLVVKDGWGIGSVFVVSCVVIFFALAAFVVWSEFTGRGSVAANVRQRETPTQRLKEH